MIETKPEAVILERCEKNKLTISEYFTLYTVSQGKKPLMLEDLKSLHEKGFVNYYDIMNFELTEKGEDIFKVSFGEELWNRYPAIFPMGGGKSFLARTGGDKMVLCELYHSRINNSEEIHNEVLKQLDRYIKMVNSGKIHGNKIITWIVESMWEQIAEIPEDDGDFKTDI